MRGHRARRLRAQPAEPAGGRRLEERYPAFDGLNLCFETREGILKHCSRRHARALAAARARRRRPALPRRHPAQPGGAAVQPGRRDRLQRARHRRRRALGPADARAARRRANCSRAAATRRWPSFPASAGARLLFDDAPPHAVGAGARPDRRDPRRARRSGAGERRCGARGCRRWCASATRCSAQRRAAQALPAARTCTATRRSSRRPTARGRWCASSSRSTVGAPATLPPARGRTPRPHRAIADYIAGMTDRFALREHERLTGQTLFPDDDELPAADGRRRAMRHRIACMARLARLAVAGQAPPDRSAATTARRCSSTTRPRDPPDCCARPPRRTGVAIHAYALTDNEVHLLATPDDEPAAWAA